MFPNIPEDRSGLSAAELRGYVRELSAFAKSVRDTDKAEAKRAIALAADLLTEAAEAEEDAALDAAIEATDLPAEPVVASDDPVVTDDDDEEDDGGDDEAEAEASTSVVPASAVTVVPTGLASGARPASRTAVLEPTTILAYDGVEGLDRGHAFGSWGDLTQALMKRREDISPTTDVKHYVGFVPSRYPEERKLTSDPVHNLRILQNVGFEQDELTAALCAPLTPYYGLACENTLRRPVAASLPGFEAPRGGVSIMPSPSLSDVTHAGIWTHEDDDDEEAEKECDEIVCGTPEDFIMYAVYWCLTVKNWTLLTYPELVEAFLNRGLAHRNRIAEIQLLEGMAAGVPTLSANVLGYGSSVSITTQVLNYLSLRRETERWDNEPMVGWAHRWLADALRVDQARRRRTDGALVVPSLDTINRQFADVGVDMTWSLDAASWMTAPPAVGAGGNASINFAGTLNPFPATAEILIAPRGKFAMIDRAQLSIGVTGNNYYRDTAMIAKNQVRFFVEDYEGVVDTTSCDAHLLEFTGLCHNGVQIDDLVIDCDGTDGS